MDTKDHRKMIAERIVALMDMFDMSFYTLHKRVNSITFRDNSQISVSANLLMLVVKGEAQLSLQLVKQIFMALNCNWLWACSKIFNPGPKRSYRDRSGYVRREI